MRRADWLSRIAPVNIATSFVILAVLLSLFSPVLDPARISVAHQIARLENGTQSAANFDFDYLKFEGKRYGLAALERLKTTSKGDDAALVRKKAAHALEKKNKWDETDQQPTALDVRANLTAWPKGKQIPDSFVDQDWGTISTAWKIPAFLRTKANACNVYMMDLNGDSREEILVVAHSHSYMDTGVFVETPNHTWQLVAKLSERDTKCVLLNEKLQANEYKLIAPRLKDLEIAGRRIPLLPETTVASVCAPPKP